MSLNDYIQLQNARAKEQERQRRIQQEEIQLGNAIRQLRAIHELQRQREERAAQAYYQELARLREQELIRQERERQIYQNYVNAFQNQYHQPAKSTMFYHPNDVLATCSTSAENQYASDSDSEEEEEAQYPQLIDILFGGASQKEKTQEQPCEKKNVAPVESPAPSAAEKQVSQEPQANAMNIDQFMEFFYDKLQKFNEAEDQAQETEVQKNQEHDQDTTEDHEPHLVPLLHEEEDQDMEEIEEAFSAANHDIEDDSEVPVTSHNNTLATQEEEVSAPANDESAAFEQQSENLASLVNELSVSDDLQQESSFSDEDPVKLAKYDALNRIEQELVEIQLKNATILQNSLDFDTNSHDSDFLRANTANNREFLGYEDQIVKIMLKLDMITSDGDEDIRNERKHLIKRAEKLLEVLDDFKHREWERASNSSECSEDEYVMA
jgi:hypothetical protein